VGDPVSHSAVCAEITGGSDGSTLTRVKIADCGNSPAAELLAGLAHSMASAAGEARPAGGPCLFIYADRDPSGRTRWVTADQLPGQWPQNTSASGGTQVIGQVVRD
jgi:hypothetical protein